MLEDTTLYYCKGMYKQMTQMALMILEYEVSFMVGFLLHSFTVTYLAEGCKVVQLRIIFAPEKNCSGIPFLPMSSLSNWHPVQKAQQMRTFLCIGLYAICEAMGVHQENIQVM